MSKKKKVLTRFSSRLQSCLEHSAEISGDKNNGFPGAEVELGYVRLKLNKYQAKKRPLSNARGNVNIALKFLTSVFIPSRSSTSVRWPYVYLSKRQLKCNSSLWYASYVTT